ncbi:uncharacterized protein FA14DRAFT_161419 [Meira miltonrushii]|uniref:N-acetyltransferase domain-containing protein n=1 Tax=Meira miltonrushii TaxID=1280837 RepID=A0A316V884_9BASI|nr:uncharacterized protein FA14DRAFT_161419 [Meira miltonrushii]PWN33690.1 hypothetical protein FA14DRAFT_161419 [Meira miltonrushii]
MSKLVSSHAQTTQGDLLSQYDFQLCSNAERLRESLDLRMKVFHNEQGFPADTEVDEYDPISAHFLVIRRNEQKTVATVRLTPYPRKEWLGYKEEEEQGYVQEQDATSVVTSGGGPGGTSGGLPMSTGPTESNIPESKTNIAPPEASDDAIAKAEYPLGRPLSIAQLSGRFNKSAHGTGRIDEEHGAPQVRGAKLSRLAVLKSERGKGLGALVMHQVEGWLIAQYLRGEEIINMDDKTKTPSPPPPFVVVVSSQQHAIPFYEKLGYSVYGDTYDEEGAPHNWCVKTLVDSRTEKRQPKVQETISSTDESALITD